MTRRAVGDVLFEYFPPNTGTIFMTIDGIVFSKTVVRQTWAANNISGAYNVVRVYRPFVCSPIGTTNDNLGEMNVTQSGSAVTISTFLGVAPTRFSCTYSGTYSQAGRMGAITGNYSCSDGTSGPFSLTEIEVSSHGFMARFGANIRGCNMYGHFGGTRSTVAPVAD